MNHSSSFSLARLFARSGSLRQKIAFSLLSSDYDNCDKYRACSLVSPKVKFNQPLAGTASTSTSKPLSQQINTNSPLLYPSMTNGKETSVKMQKMSSLGHYLCDTWSKAYISPRVTCNTSAEVLDLTVHAVSTALLKKHFGSDLSKW